MGSTMTGVLGIPAGSGPFAVVVVNHGYVPESQYYVGQDSSKYGDPMAAAGFLTVSPNYPGYAGPGPASAELPSIVDSRRRTLCRGAYGGTGPLCLEGVGLRIASEFGSVTARVPGE
jgi:hypothetical protein